MRVCLLLLLLFGLVSPAVAGGGPENVMVVVNRNSPASLEVANHYIRLRSIPPENVVYVNYGGSEHGCSVKRFRRDILRPVLQTINDRKLAAQIDIVAYSVDLPWQIDLKGDLPEGFPKSQAFHPYASITGATFLHQGIIAQSPAVMATASNRYLAGKQSANTARCSKLGDAPSQGFRSRYYWDAQGNKSTEQSKGQRYLLSTMLGVTAGRGMSVEAVVQNLSRSSKVDASRPEGAFYFMANKDIRSKTRDACYEGVVAMLRAEGAQAVVQQGILPNRSSNVLGLTMGSKEFNVASAGFTIAPGALCDNLTSYGGDFRRDFQVPLTDFLAAGAAGATGTVFEPTAMQAKFPLPTLHVHYRRGCSLAESYYQSISCPYQLLVVGDPLCQPWARIPQVELTTTAKPNAAIDGDLLIKQEITAADGTEVQQCEVFLNGRLAIEMPAGADLPLKTARLSPGYHRVTIVAHTSDPIETRGRGIVEFTVADRPGAAAPQVGVGASLVRVTGNVTVNRIGDYQGEIEVLQNSRVVATISDGASSVQIAAATLGRGPVALRPRAKDSERFGRPVSIVLE